MAREIGKLAQRYARALYTSVVSEMGVSGSPTPAQRAAAGLWSLAELWRGSRELSGSLVNPMFERQGRERALERLARQLELPDVVLRGLKVIFEHDRIAALPEIAAAFKKMADDAAGVVPVEVQTARPVPEQEARTIEERLRQSIAGQLQFSWTLKPDLIAGMVVKYQGKVVDGSLSSRLDQIERKLRG